MTSSRLFAAALAVPLVGCAGAPRPAAPVPSPAAESVYEYSGQVPSVGLVAGLIRVDSEGALSLGTGDVSCSAPAGGEVVTISCGPVRLRVARDGGGLAERASVRVGVRETVAPGEQCYLRAATEDATPGRCIAAQGRSTARTTYHRGTVEVRRVE